MFGFAVTVILAGTFGAVVTPFTNDTMMPVDGQAFGNVEFSELKNTLI